MKKIKNFICGPICGTMFIFGLPITITLQNIYATVVCLICGLIFTVWYG